MFITIVSTYLGTTNRTPNFTSGSEKICSSMPTTNMGGGQVERKILLS